MKIPDIKQPGPGDLVCILVCDMNPPTHDVRHAADALLSRPDVSGLWLCPLYGKAADVVHQRNMGMTFCAEYAAATGKLASMCSVALDKKMSQADDVAKWAVGKRPDMRFVLAGFLSQLYFVRFFGQADAPIGSTPVSIEKFNAVSDGIRERILSGHDEARNMFAGVWGYVQKHRLYR